MTADEVEIGAKYKAKVGNKVVTIKIDRQIKRRHYQGPGRMTERVAWEATNTETGRTVTIKSAAKLRVKVTE